MFAGCGISARQAVAMAWESSQVPWLVIGSPIPAGQTEHISQHCPDPLHSTTRQFSLTSTVPPPPCRAYFSRQAQYVVKPCFVCIHRSDPDPALLFEPRDVPKPSWFVIIRPCGRHPGTGPHIPLQLHGLRSAKDTCAQHCDTHGEANGTRGATEKMQTKPTLVWRNGGPPHVIGQKFESF